MNHILIYFMAILMGGNLANKDKSAETVSLTINYEVLNTIKGYSYDSRVDVYIDGNKVGVSSVKDQQVPNHVTVSVPVGNHNVKAVMSASYKGEWEERTVENEYGTDFIWAKNITFKKDMKVKLYFDIDSGVHEKKKPKSKKK